MTRPIDFLQSSLKKVHIKTANHSNSLDRFSAPIHRTYSILDDVQFTQLLNEKGL